MAVTNNLDETLMECPRCGYREWWDEDCFTRSHGDWYNCPSCPDVLKEAESL